jgi:tetratricopeptide (TPR) repeat protein
VLVISRKSFLPLALAAAVTVAVAGRPAFAQAAQGTAQGAQKNWKDRAEYDLYEAISKETAPAKRLELLNQWKEKYPNSDFADVRQQVYMATYSQMGRGADALTAAGEILAKDPNNLQALSSALTSIFTVQNPSPENLATAEKAANQVISNLDTLFAADKKPANVKEADWETAKKNLHVYAQNALGYVAWQRKDYAKAEQEFTKSLQLEPDQGQVSYWLSVVILAERDPKKYPVALFHYARAAAYDGPGSLNATGRQTVMQQFQKTFNTYHGEDQKELDRVIAAAKASALPPPGFDIASKADIARKQIEDENKLKEQNPSLALWLSLKKALTGDQAQSYFDEHMKDTEIPTDFKGKLIEAKPEMNPKELVLSIEDGITPDATLVLETPLKGKMDPGADMSFKNGVATAYAASPYMVTFKVEKENITGWKGVAPPAPAKAKRAPVRRPAQKK